MTLLALPLKHLAPRLLTLPLTQFGQLAMTLLEPVPMQPATRPHVPQLRQPATTLLVPPLMQPATRPPALSLRQPATTLFVPSPMQLASSLPPLPITTQLGRMLPSSPTQQAKARQSAHVTAQLAVPPSPTLSSMQMGLMPPRAPPSTQPASIWPQLVLSTAQQTKPAETLSLA